MSRSAIKVYRQAVCLAGTHHIDIHPDLIILTILNLLPHAESLVSTTIAQDAAMMPDVDASIPIPCRSAVTARPHQERQLTQHPTIQQRKEHRQPCPPTSSTSARRQRRMLIALEPWPNVKEGPRPIRTNQNSPLPIHKPTRHSRHPTRQPGPDKTPTNH